MIKIFAGFATLWLTVFCVCSAALCALKLFGVI